MRAKLWFLIGLLLILVWFGLGAYWARDPDVLYHQQLSAWHGRCDQFRDVTYSDTPVVIANAERCNAELAQLVAERERR